MISHDEAVQRLRQTVHAERGALARFCEHHGITKPAIWYVLTGRNKMSARVASTLGLAVLETRRGRMFMEVPGEH